MDSVLKRRLFMEPPARKASGGILSLVEDEEDEDSYEDRSPDNPEIMANSLRGDIRSMDERYLELARMVGDKAFETPEEVVVLMQQQLAQQAAQQPPTVPAPGPQGLASLGQGVPPGPPPRGGAPGGMPPGMPPGMPMEQPPEMAPQGIAALTPENEAPPPVQRQQGSPPMGEFSRPNAYTGEDVPPGDQTLSMQEFDLDQGIEAYLAGGGSEQDLMAAASGAIPEVVVGEGMEPGADIPGIAESGRTQELNLARQGMGGGAPAASGAMDFSKLFPPQEGTGGFSEEMLRQHQEEIEEFIRRQQRNRSAAGESNPLLAPLPTGFEEPVQRARGSGPGGERVEPRMPPPPQPAQIPRNAPSYIQDLMRQGVVSPDYSNIPRSRPFTPEELAERVRQRENQSPLMRRIYDFARQRGIDPNVAEARINRFLRLPGVQAVSRAAGVAGRAIFNPLTAAGMLAADAGQRLAPSIAGVTMIPEEFRTEPGTLPGVNPLPIGGLADKIPPAVPEGGVYAGPGPEQFPPRKPTDLTPVNATSPPVVDIGDVDAEESYSPTRGRDPQGAILPPPGLAGSDERRTEVTTTDRVPPQEEDESDSDFAARVRKRADLYRELMGDNEAARKAQAYGILAEVGFRLAGAKGRSLGERLSKGMEGAGAAFSQLAANQAAMDRQLMASAISAEEQLDRDAMKYASQIRTKMLEIERRNLPRQQKIQQRMMLIMAQTPSITEEGARRIATLMEDGLIVADTLGNLRGPEGKVEVYGPSNRPTPRGSAGFVEDNYPFLTKDAPTPSPAFTVEEMQTARDERLAAQSLLGGLQRAKGNLAAAYGPLNVITRGITSVTQPIVGNIGPFSADNFGAANAIRQFQKDLRELLVLNPNRATKYELELMEPLMDNPNNILKSPEIALANLLEIERTLINRINAADYRLNPNISFKQIGSIPLGTKNQPLPSTALEVMGEHYRAMPNATIYYTRSDGRVVGLNKQQYDQMMRGMRGQ